MPATKRRIDPGLAQQLFEEPHRFQFFQAMRILERLFRRQDGRQPDAIALSVRFRNSLSLAFPATELDAEATVASRDGEALQNPAALIQAIDDGALGQVQLTANFMGLLGVAGALPLHYTETLGERELYGRDRAARAFLDMFSTRAVALHYAAWKKHRLALQYELDRRERFMPLVMSLAGLGSPASHDALVDGRGDVFDQAVAYYAGAIRQRPVSAAVLRRVLSDYFRVRVQVEQFVGAWYRVPPEQRTRLGMANAQLGRSALAGERIWQRDLRLRLRIGPLARQAFDDFLPGSAAAQALAKWLGLLTGAGLEYEVRLALNPADVPAMRMTAATGPRLGWDSYLCSRPQRHPREDTTYHLRTIH